MTERRYISSIVTVLDERWWSDSMECYCNPRNVQDLLADGKSITKDDLDNHSKGQ